MSTISGRFLYQFGLTAAVAILVSLLVSFTLTPMMSARLFRGTSWGEELRRWRPSGFFGRLDARSTRASSHWAHGAPQKGRDRPPPLVALSSWPIYRLVRQELIPSNVDEAEFDVEVTAPEGTSLAGDGRGDARRRAARSARRAASPRS